MKTILRIGLCAGGLLAVLLILQLGEVVADGPRQFSAGDCAGCHPGQYRGWLLSSHRLTLYDRVFQEAWKREKRSTECLTCHTTGYDEETGPLYWGVTCAACHQPAGAVLQPGEERDHEPLTIPDESADCAACHQGGHTVTYAEWAASDHNGYRPANCQDCHDAHSVALVAGNITDLCGICHLQPVPTDAPYMHYEGTCTNCHAHEISVDNVHMRGGDKAAASCVDCHMLSARNFKGYLTASGHGMTVSLASCVGCHGSLHEMAGGSSP
ncbi:MAG: hypothetical protein HPY64_14445 [Anaerolineae bacterium]|nr:hypothetical protein [Anaerolineae bacterium]